MVFEAVPKLNVIVGAHVSILSPTFADTCLEEGLFRFGSRILVEMKQTRFACF